MALPALALLPLHMLLALLLAAAATPLLARGSPVPPHAGAAPSVSTGKAKVGKILPTLASAPCAAGAKVYRTTGKRFVVFPAGLAPTLNTCDAPLLPILRLPISISDRALGLSMAAGVLLAALLLR
jgi:hypothetical protein